MVVIVKRIDPLSVIVALVVAPFDVVVVVPEVNSHEYVSPAPPPEAVKVTFESEQIVKLPVLEVISGVRSSST